LALYEDGLRKAGLPEKSRRSGLLPKRSTRIDCSPENPSALSKPDGNYFPASLAWTSSRILLQQNRHEAGIFGAAASQSVYWGMIWALSTSALSLRTALRRGLLPR